MANGQILQVNSFIALDQLEEAVEVVRTVENSPSKIRILLQIARKYEYRQKLPQKALDVWIQALGYAQSISDTAQREESILLVIGAIDFFESFMEPEAVVSILQVLQKFPEDYLKINTLLRQHYYNQALQTAQTLLDREFKVDALIKIVMKRAQQGQPEQAFELWQVASKVAQKIINLDKR